MPSDMNGCCSECGRGYSGDTTSRFLREHSGHARCYSCVFSSSSCPLCPHSSRELSEASEDTPPPRPSLRSSSASPCRHRSSSFRSMLRPRLRSPAPLPPPAQMRPPPYYHQQIHGNLSNNRQGRRRSRRVSVPLPLPHNAVSVPVKSGLKLGSGIGDSQTSFGQSCHNGESLTAEEEDLYARFQLLLCPSSQPLAKTPLSLADSLGSCARHRNSCNSSPFSTITDSSEMDQKVERSPEESIYSERFQSGFYCPSLYATPRSMPTCKPPLPTHQLNRHPLRPPPPPSSINVKRHVNKDFVGRSWLLDEISNTVLSESSNYKGMIITGGVGTGKTALIINILDHVEAYKSKFERVLKMFLKKHTHFTYTIFSSKFLSESLSTEIYSEPISGEDNTINTIASRVVAYHLCMAGDVTTDLIPDFVHSLANQLCQSHLLGAYKSLLESDLAAQTAVSLSFCIANPSEALSKGIFDPLHKLRRRGKITKHPVVVVIDGLPELSFPTKDSVESLTHFLLKEIERSPNVLKFVLTLRTPVNLNTFSVPMKKISLDISDESKDAENVRQDLMEYVLVRSENSQRFLDNISVIPDALENRSVLDRFTEHVVRLSKGSFLFVKLILNLIENGLLVLKSGSFKILPQSLSEIFLLMFNLKFPTTMSYGKHKPILNVLLASHVPLTLLEIYQSVSAGLLYHFPSWSQFLILFKSFKDLLRKRSDNTYVFFHPALREWLIKRQKGESVKFLCDLKQGHSCLALKLSRIDFPLNEQKTLQLAHHIVKSNCFEIENDCELFDKKNCQALWVIQSSISITAALCCPRNLFHPDLEISKLLLIAGASANQTTSLIRNSSILGVASHLGFKDFAMLLLTHKANPNLSNSDGDTPLIAAAAAGHLDIVQILVENGADATIRNALEETALVKAAAAGHLATVSYLLRCQSRTALLRSQAQQAVVAAARHGHVQTMDHLIQFNEELVDGTDTMSNDSPLVAAAKCGQVETIKCLFQWRVSKSKRSARGELPLCCTVQNGHYEASKLLIDYGADVNDKNSDGRTPLIIAASEGHFGLMELLTTHGADLSLADKDNMTALSWSCVLGKRHSVQYLLDQGADVNHANHYGRTPLDLAADNGNAAIVRLLLESGALIEHVDLSGMRPVDRAVGAGNAEAVECFLKKGAKLGPTTWTLAADKPNITLMLLNKLKDDGLALLRKNRLKEAAHRFSYALRKIPTGSDNQDLLDTLANLRLHLTLNLSRTKRKMNELGEAIQLANTALQLSKDSYESYYARAQAKRKGGKLEDALEDIECALRLMPEFCVSGNIHKCLTDVRNEIIEDLKEENRGDDPKLTQINGHQLPCTSNLSTSIRGPDSDQVMTSSFLSESGYSSNF